MKMDDCSSCPITKTTRAEGAAPQRNSLRKHRYQHVSQRKRRSSPTGCEPCGREDVCFPRKPYTYYGQCEPCSPCEPCGTWEPCHRPSPCRNRCSYPGRTESGLLNTIRCSIQRLFTSRKPNQLYMYSMSQLKCIGQIIDKLEDETSCIDEKIKRAVKFESNIDCNYLRCTLDTITGRVEGVKYDLMCARNCYDPCRDRCEFELICCLMERVCGLESILEELGFQLDCLREPAPCDTCCAATARATCRHERCCGSSRSPPCSTKRCGRSSCGKTGCDSGCRTACCGLPNSGKLGNMCYPKGLCRTSSVIPVGVMLVKL